MTERKCEIKSITKKKGTAKKQFLLLTSSLFCATEQRVLIISILDFKTGGAGWRKLKTSNFGTCMFARKRIVRVQSVSLW
jgi:hypothetical protein